jgi:single-strand DNA-binding protein
MEYIMQGINQVVLMGRLGATPELQTTESGRQICRMRLATNQRKPDGESWTNVTLWHSVTLWERQAETAAKHLQVGDLVAVEGQLVPRTWTDPDGNRRRRVDVVGKKLHFVRNLTARPRVFDLLPEDDTPTEQITTAEARDQIALPKLEA